MEEDYIACNRQDRGLSVIARDWAQQKGIPFQSSQQLTADFTTNTVLCLPAHRFLEDTILLQYLI